MAANRMIERSMWRSVHLDFNDGNRVIIRPKLLNNINTRRLPLYVQLNMYKYVVIDVLQFDKVKIFKESEPSSNKQEISIRALRLVVSE